MYEGERFNSATHLVGLVLAIGAAIALMTRAAYLEVSASLMLSSAIFSFAMIAVYASSALFHSTRGSVKAFWEKVDHCAIYLLIAGTYTSLAFGPVRSDWATVVGVLIWLLAFVGIGRELWWDKHAPPALILYLVMGWLGVVFAYPSARALSASCLYWLIAGAVLYSVGTVFYANDKRWRHAHGIWHLFVIGGTACHFVTVYRFLYA